MNRVFVLGSTKKPLMPCHPARARELLRKSKAAVFRMEPFTIILSGREDGEVQDIEFKASPGGKATGIALVGLFRSGARLRVGKRREGSYPFLNCQVDSPEEFFAKELAR